MFRLIKSKFSKACQNFHFSDLTFAAPSNSILSSESYIKHMGSQGTYQVNALINNGACADVYEGVHLPSGEKIIIKAITTSTLNNKVVPKKELIYLNYLNPHPHISTLLDYFIEQDSGMLCLVLKYFPNEICLQSCYLNVISPFDLKVYMRQLLGTLKYCHDRKLAHLDIKPHNILVDVIKKEILLIDFGSAEFLNHEKEKSLNVYSRFMKPPEILLGNTNYTLSGDIWATGAIFAGMIFEKDPYFAGPNHFEQINCIAQILGFNSIRSYIEKYGLKVDQRIKELLKMDLKEKIIDDEGKKKYATEDAIDLVKKMLVIDHNERITANEALNHRYFKT